MKAAIIAVFVSTLVGISAVVGAFYTYEGPDLTVEDKLSLGNLHLACTPEEKAVGLSVFSELSAGEGMLFPYAEEREISIWMKGMEFPIDIVWIGENDRITRIEENVPLCGTECTFAGTGWAVLELSAGTVDEHGLERGDRVSVKKTCAS